MKENGQSLLEIAITLGIVIVVASALAIITINGIKNSQFSKNQALATKFAQEGLESVRTIRDRDYTVCLDKGNPSSCENWSKFWGISCDPSCEVNLSFNKPSCSPTEEEIPFCLIASEKKESIEGKFERQIQVTEAGPNQKQVKSKVSWTDASGTHASELVTILAKF